MSDRQNYREAMGERLKAFRLERGLSAYAVAKKGDIQLSQVKAVEDGLTNYTLDIFIGYIIGCDLYLFFGEKSKERVEPHDFDDLAKKANENKPGR